MLRRDRPQISGDGHTALLLAYDIVIGEVFMSYEEPSGTQSTGDSEGRRLAQRRAGLLSEAGRVARVLEILLDRADYPSDPLSRLISNIGKQEATELQRGFGRIEPRTRFRVFGGHPLLAKLSTVLFFVDESGVSHIQPGSDTPYFALGAIAMTPNEAERYCKKSDQIKEEFFGRTGFQFHEPYMRRRTQSSNIDYSFNGNSDKQHRFDVVIRQLIETTQFHAFGVVVRKEAFKDEFLETQIDPYLPTDCYSLAITLLFERCADALGVSFPRSIGRVQFESQGPREDAYHQLEFARLLLEGSQWVSEKAFRSLFETGLKFMPKQGSDPGELADFFARELFEWVSSDCRTPPKWWDVFNRKVYCREDGGQGKFGVKVFPDSDIRERIEAHRRRCGAKIPPKM